MYYLYKLILLLPILLLIHSQNDANLILDKKPLGLSQFSEANLFDVAVARLRLEWDLLHLNHFYDTDLPINSLGHDYWYIASHLFKYRLDYELEAGAMLGIQARNDLREIAKSILELYAKPLPTDKFNKLPLTVRNLKLEKLFNDWLQLSLKALEKGLIEVSSILRDYTIVYKLPVINLKADYNQWYQYFEVYRRQQIKSQSLPLELLEQLDMNHLSIKNEKLKQAYTVYLKTLKKTEQIIFSLPEFSKNQENNVASSKPINRYTIITPQQQQQQQSESKKELSLKHVEMENSVSQRKIIKIPMKRRKKIRERLGNTVKNKESFSAANSRGNK